MCGSGFDGAFGSLDRTFGGGRDGGVSEPESESEDESICWYPVVVGEEARALPAGFLAWERRRTPYCGLAHSDRFLPPQRARVLPNKQTNSMLQRARGCHARDRLLYQLGAKKFADLEPILYEVAELLLAFFLRPHADDVAFLFSSLNKATRQLFRTMLMQMQPPVLGDAKPWCDWRPVFHNLRERVGWVFARCHMCDDHDATDRVGLALVDETRMATAMVCRDCRDRLWMHRIGNRFLELQGGRLVIVGVETLDTDLNVAHSLALFKANMDCVRVKLTRVAEQRWRLPIANSRQARRSVPFSIPVLPRLKLERCTRKVTELVASVKFEGGHRRTSSSPSAKTAPTRCSRAQPAGVAAVVGFDGATAPSAAPAARDDDDHRSASAHVDGAARRPQALPGGHLEAAEEGVHPRVWRAFVRCGLREMLGVQRVLNAARRDERRRGNAGSGELTGVATGVRRMQTAEIRCRQ